MTARIIKIFKNVSEVICEPTRSSNRTIIQEEAIQSLTEELFGISHRKSFPVQRLPCEKGDICTIKAKEGYEKVRGKIRQINPKHGVFILEPDASAVFDNIMMSKNWKELSTSGPAGRQPVHAHYNGDGCCIMRRLYGARAETDLYCHNMNRGCEI